MNAKLEAIAEQASENLKTLIKEGEENILRAWAECEDEAQAEEKAAKFKLGFGITIDIGENNVDYDLTFAIRRKLTISSEIPDPNQLELPVDEDQEPASEEVKAELRKFNRKN